MYPENCKTLFKEIKEGLNKWKAIPCSWIGRYWLAENILQIDVHIQCNPYQYPSWFFCRN